VRDTYLQEGSFSKTKRRKYRTHPEDARAPCLMEGRIEQDCAGRRRKGPNKALHQVRRGAGEGHDDSEGRSSKQLREGKKESNAAIYVARALTKSGKEMKVILLGSDQSERKQRTMRRSNTSERKGIT